jgi:hypothetical protein
MPLPSAPPVAAPALASPSLVAPSLAAPRRAGLLPDDDPSLVLVHVRTRPEGALVNIDGQAAGKSPLRIKVKPGRHEVEAIRPRYQTEKLTADAPADLLLLLKRPTATVRFSSDPPGADVRVDGDPVGITPVEIQLPAYITYKVELSAPGSALWHKRVMVRPTLTQVEATLAPKIP